MKNPDHPTTCTCKTCFEFVFGFQANMRENDRRVVNRLNEAAEQRLRECDERNAHLRSVIQ